MTKDKEFAIIGLGKMGGNLALNALDKGFKVVGIDPSGCPEELKGTEVEYLEKTAELKERLSPTRIIFLYVPAGPVVDKVIDELSNTLKKGDIIVDAGNSYWGDSIRRAEKLQEKEIYFIDCGTSGGIRGAREGACFMFGGEKEPAQMLLPILQELAVEGGVVHTGAPGSGHFVKLVHNGIEFGMLQAIGEGMDLLANYKEKLNMEAVLHCWNNGSVIRSWLTELMEEQLKKQDKLNEIPAYVEDTGEVNWLVNDALHMEVPVPVISQSVMQLLSSREQNQTWAQAIALMRHGFGEHPFGENESIKKERKEGKIGKTPTFPGKKEE